MQVPAVLGCRTIQPQLELDSARNTSDLHPTHPDAAGWAQAKRGQVWPRQPETQGRWWLRSTGGADSFCEPQRFRPSPLWASVKHVTRVCAAVQLAAHWPPQAGGRSPGPVWSCRGALDRFSGCRRAHRDVHSVCSILVLASSQAPQCTALSCRAALLPLQCSCVCTTTSPPAMRAPMQLTWAHNAPLPMQDTPHCEATQLSLCSPASTAHHPSTLLYLSNCRVPGCWHALKAMGGGRRREMRLPGRASTCLPRTTSRGPSSLPLPPLQPHSRPGGPSMLSLLVSLLVLFIAHDVLACKQAEGCRLSFSPLQPWPAFAVRHAAAATWSCAVIAIGCSDPMCFVMLWQSTPRGPAAAASILQ